MKIIPALTLGEGGEPIPTLELSELYTGVFLRASDCILLIAERDGRWQVRRSEDHAKTWSDWEEFPARRLLKVPQ